MAFRYFLFTVMACFVLQVCGCDDEYGSPFHLVVPINTATTSDSINVGDTIWIEADFSKQVELYHHESSIWLDSFQFFTQLVISEMTGPETDYSYDFNKYSTIGDLQVLPLGNVIGFPLKYQERKEAYRFKGGIVLNTPGIYYLRFSTNRKVIGEHYTNHPALYDCKGKRRSDVWVVYLNEASTRNNYDSLFLKTGVDDFIRLIDYDRYVRFGGYTFVVKE